ncbi:MAG: hypothetical protein C0501_01515, partial [Isosphaera sp.]|nr:hypothetical protein [Isosphaera sp.]
ELSYLILAVTANPAEHLGHPSILSAVLPEGHPGRDLAVVIPLLGTSRTFCRQSVRAELDGGARAVWLVDFETRTVTVYQEGRRGTEFDSDDTLDGGDGLPGFSCKVSDLFG